MKKIAGILSLSLFVMSANAQTNTWQLDKAHSKISFTIDHMVITEVEGRFTDFDINFSSGENFENPNLNVDIKTASINTDNEQRDAHLKSADFFDATNNPDITFKATSFTKVADMQYKLKGNLTMHGITKPIELDVKYGGTIKDPRGNTKIGFKVSGTLNRYDYNLKYNSVLETGALMIGEEVTIQAFVEMKKM
jgi:polyisoprenoid-binding protein YceI